MIRDEMQKQCRDTSAALPVRSKGKTVPLWVRSGPEDSRMWRFPDFATTAQDGCKVVSLTHRLPLPPGIAPGTHFSWRLGQPQGHSTIGRILYQWKFSMTPTRIEPATFRFIAQHLNHCATAMLFLWLMRKVSSQGPPCFRGVQNSGSCAEFRQYMFVCGFECRARTVTI